MSTAPVHPIPSAAGVSTAIDPEPRATFGWRPGSIRGLLSLLVLGLLWSVALLEWKPVQQMPGLYIYLQCLLVLIVAYYFPPIGSISPVSRSDRRILRLWPEVVPWVLVAGSIGLGVWVWFHHEGQGFEMPSQVNYILPLVLLGGFYIGHALTWFISRASGGRLPPFLQDLQAWAALVAMVVLGAVTLVRAFVLPGLEPPDRQEALRNALTPWEGVLIGLVSFYFGARTETPRVSS